MAKIKELSEALDEIIGSAGKVVETAKKMKASFASEEEDWNNYRDEELARDKNEEERKQLLTLEEVRKVLAEKSRNGHTAEIKGLLKKYGADRLSLVDPEKYEDLLKDAEAIQDGGK